MLDKVEAADSNTWLLQLYLISLQDSLDSSLGLDTVTSIEVAANFAQSESMTNTTAALSALLQTTRSTAKASIIAQPLMLLLDGGEASFSDGESIPIPKKTVTDNGTIQTTGYQYVDTGLRIKTRLREVSPTSAKCSLAVDLQSISGYTESAPRTKGQRFNTEAVLRSGGVYLLGSLKQAQSQNDSSGPWFRTLFNKNSREGTIQIWLKCYRINGPLDERKANDAALEPDIELN
jgi:type II secretory pathway component GspD/PulD (secretin)